MEALPEDSEAKAEGSGDELDIRELRAKKQVLARKVAEQQRRQDKIQVGAAPPGGAPRGGGARPFSPPQEDRAGPHSAMCGEAVLHPCPGTP